MNCLRSTHEPLKVNHHPVIVEPSRRPRLEIDLLYSFMEAWLQQNCRWPWSLEHYQENRNDGVIHDVIKVDFSDGRDAMLFKLSDLYDKARR